MNRREFLKVCTIGVLLASCKKVTTFPKENQLTFFPVIMQGKTIALPLGVQIEHHQAQSVKQWIIPNRQYQIPIKWRDVETVRGIYDWSLYDPDFEALAGQKVTAGIKVVPEWARLWKGYVASPPKPLCFYDLANFVIKVIERYHVDAVELFNEPDVDLISTIPYAEYFGAWCISSDWYMGGTRYGQCLNAIYPVIHAAYPNVRIIAGALIGGIPSSIEFLQGAINTGLRCDAISFHKYIGLGGNFNSAFEFGKLVKQKINKPQVLSETGITSSIDSLELQQAQAGYLKYLKQNYRTSTVSVIQWYSLANNGWMNTDLVRNNESTLAYKEFIREVEHR